ncbi:hypothetical protein C8F04DRAFT_1262340 [Mycena alexandri]|uniref:Uncharacterized protein n=1 Tax=Mycena alexandri TaxID=1745969 RepID=A0AAD6SQU7_9AGAR|nr:hypothetical protein C8F04DRAFT_1262340 [Mycena alexandri]
MPSLLLRPIAMVVGLDSKTSIPSRLLLRSQVSSICDSNPRPYGIAQEASWHNTAEWAYVLKSPQTILGTFIDKLSVASPPPEDVESDMVAPTFALSKVPGAKKPGGSVKVVDSRTFKVAQTFSAAEVMVEAGNVGYVRPSLGNYVANTGNTTLKFLEIFKSGVFQDISLTQLLALTPRSSSKFISVFLTRLSRVSAALKMEVV